MKVLVIFETVEGQTRKIAEFVEQQIRAAGHEVQMFNAADRLGPLSFDGISKVVLAAPVHERRHPEGFEVLVSASLADLKARQTLLISVSLKAAFPEGMEEARDYLTELEMRTGFEPNNEVLVAGAVRARSYGYYESQIVQNVALDGRKVELVDGVREFTDWDALGDEIGAFLQAAP
ncbi:flavodoxin domain-containing protein [Puniceibacterium sediminis]|uniref:Menaquinone-dependent protoporphyrinogen oxidase n=1 Tax=Puniceibacterium sediminis TaxID=1608407 RepID=A0A238X9G9_9RHOB|nr:flavodoxin domain-containing protein [Puniceibacterium sediminis]SNR54499.1 menaquinone-dependent protoporphyrinogen oxidase [Puniceibacterium sediminis]